MKKATAFGSVCVSMTLLLLFVCEGFTSLVHMVLPRSAWNKFVSMIYKPEITFLDVIFTGDAAVIASFYAGEPARLGITANPDIVLNTG